MRGRGGRPRDLGIDGYTDFVRIGTGGTSTVYRARQTLFDRTVAVKVLSAPVVDEAARRRFQRECSAAGRISDHPHVATVLDAGFTATGSPFLTVEYCPGGSLLDQLTERGPLPAAEVIDVGRKLASGLQAVHDAGLLHRDLKPANVLISAYGEPELTDFGIALTEARVTATGRDRATPYFTAPEVLGGGEPTIAADVFALAATLYQLLDGNPPRYRKGAEPLDRFLARLRTEPAAPIGRPDVPDALEELLAGALAPDPALRPRTAEAFGAALEALAPAPTSDGRDEIDAPAAVDARESGRPWLARVPLWAGVVALVVGALAVVGLVALLGRDGTSSTTAADGGAATSTTTAADGLVELLGDLRLGGAPVYARLEPLSDDSGLLTLEVPVEWGDRSTAGAGAGDQSMPGLAASDDLGAMARLAEASGVEVIVVPLEGEPNAAALRARLEEEGATRCRAVSDPVRILTQSASGWVAVARGCPGTDGIYAAALVRSPGDEAVFLGVLLQTDADVALLDQLLTDAVS